MDERTLAKNILLNRSCYRCVYYVWEQGDVEFCERNVKRGQEQLYDSYADTEPLPEEFTCEYWKNYE